MGFEDTLKIFFFFFFFFFKGRFVQKGSSGTYFDHGQFEIKTFPIYVRPKWICTELPFVSIIILHSIVVRYDHDSGICGGGGVITFLYIPKGGHHFFSFDKGGYVFL